MAAPKKGNTATLLHHALEGAESTGAKTKLYHLYDLDFSGCISCFACKRIGGKSYGHCAVKDDLAEVFAKVAKADAILIGSPIYISVPSGETRCFLKRLISPYLVYDRERSTLCPRKIRTAFIYTAGATDEMLSIMGVPQSVKTTENVMAQIFGSCESFFVTDTFQFSDYAKYVSTAFDPEEKKKRRDEQFPIDCKKACELGARLVKKEE
jgi:multimeric flavodoxin WrbA